MIFPWPFAVSSIAITFIKIILSGTIGAVFTFYVRYSHDDYANSIRWSRLGGLYETTTLLKNSWRKLPKRSCIVMTVMIIANALTLFVTIFLGAFVSRTDMASDPSWAVVVTGQVPPGHFQSWADWSGFMQADAAMEDTLELVLNNTRWNPNPLPQTVYTPRKYDYEILCDETGLLFGNSNENFSLVYPSPNDDCNVLLVVLQNGFGYNWDAKKATNRLISEGVHMATAPFSYSSEMGGDFLELEPSVTTFNGVRCSSCSPDLALFMFFPKDGLTSLPKTCVTRCQYDTDDAIVTAATYTKFAVNRLNDFDKITTSIMDDASSLPLLQPMRTAINNGTFLTTTYNSASVNSTLVILTSISTNVDLFMCTSTFSNTTSVAGTVGLICSYVHFTAIAIKPQPWDPITPADFKQSIDAKLNITNKNEITIYHLPSGSKDSMATYSSLHLLKATTDAAVYLASLGHNVVMNTQVEQLYILYDTIELKDAFEVPTPLLIFLLVFSLVCIIVWASSAKLAPVFSGSVYKVIYEEIKSKDDKTQMLMDCTHNPLVFEGYQVIPDLGEQAGRTSQEYGVVVIGNGSTKQPPTQQISMQETPVLQDMPALNSLLPHASPFASAQTITPALVSPAPPTFPVNPVTLTSTVTSSYHTATTPLSSLPVSPIYAPPIPPRPHAHDGTLTGASFTQLLPPLHSATNHVSQETPSSAPHPPIQSSTLIQNPFW
ncbi:hypothetical protein BKA57DRAFT_452079 [Linnemannia elongata]|nr:hypothetical protein BKA57DRAFT_452079 [Linnemannia elongata]